MPQEIALPTVSHIVCLESVNVKKLRAVRIEAKGSGLVVVGGANEAGKSSVLDSIAMVLGGRSEMPPVPVRKGQKRAQIICDLGTIIVKRTLTKEGGGTLTIEGADGQKFTSPQTLLEQLTGKIAFDPVSFMRLDAKRQAETLRQLVGLDFSAIENKHIELYEQRTTVNSERNRAHGLFTGLPRFEGVPATEISSADVLAEIKSAQTHNATVGTLASAAKAAATSVTTEQATHERLVLGAAELRDQIRVLQEKLANVTEKADAQARIVTEARGRAAEAQTAAEAVKPIDTTLLEQRLSSAEETNRKVRANMQKDAAKKTLDDAQRKSDALTQQIDDNTAKKQELLAAAKFPVAGLGFNEDGVTFNDLPLEQTSSAQQLRISVAIAASMNPKLRVMLVRDGSLLDDANLELLKNLATEFNVQVWVERVGRGEECSVIINDGAVEGAEETATEETT